MLETFLFSQMFCYEEYFVLYLCDFLHVMYIGMMLFTMTCSDSLSYVIQAVGIRLVLIILLILMEVEWSTVYSFSLS